jgi:hypothetical protein
MTFTDHLKNFIWRRVITPFFPLLYRTIGSFKFVRRWGHEGYRQRYHLGWLKPGRSRDDFLEHLRTKGFGNHFIAWQDSGQVASVRRLDGFGWQYHIRVFTDGEVCGHYEKTPESHPIDHFLEIGETDRHREFMAALGDWVIPGKAPRGVPPSRRG